MSRFVFGDDLGNVKTLKFQPDAEEKATVKTIHSHPVGDERVGIQKIAACPGERPDTTLLATASSNGSVTLRELSEDDELQTVCQWTEKRLKDNQFIGLALTPSSVISCTSNGALRRARFSLESSSVTQEEKGSLPTRLRDWKLSSDGKHFTYGGEEVEVSVWDTEQAFQTPPATEASASTGKKRRRADALFPGEIWRAKNLPNDGLSLRPPVRITSVSFLPSSGSSHNIVAGTLLNDVRRYDTRVARRPVADWKVGKVGGIRTLQPGLNENELFVSDYGTNFYSMDLRNGQILYGYPGVSGAVTSIAVSPSALATTSLDRYVRTHDAVPPPSKAGSRMDKKGAVLSKTYASCIPTCIAWDGRNLAPMSGDSAEADIGEDGDEEDVWEGMEDVSEDEDLEEKRKQKRRNTKY